MSHLKSKVGPWRFHWKGIPQGRTGEVEVEVFNDPHFSPSSGSSGPVGSLGSHGSFKGIVRWSRDPDGIWLELPHGVFGFDLKLQTDEAGAPVYSLARRISHQEWAGVTATLGEEGDPKAGKAQAAQVYRVRAQMPGKILRILVQPDQVVEKGHPVVVMEAMKMENELRAPHSGKVMQLYVSEGQAVETGVDLLVIDGKDGKEKR